MSFEPTWNKMESAPRCGRLILVAPFNPDGSLSVSIICWSGRTASWIKTGSGVDYFSTPKLWSELPYRNDPAWQPIEKAPKDRSAILCICENTQTYGILKWIGDKGGYFGAADFGSLVGKIPDKWKFNRWMPLPLQPVN